MLLATFLQEVVVPVVGQTTLIKVATLLAPVVFMAVLLLRQAMPGIGGIWAVVLNFTTTSLAYVLALPRAEWFTTSTLLALAATMAAAAGIQGTIKSLSQPKVAEAVSPEPANDIPLTRSVNRKGVQREDLP